MFKRWLSNFIKNNKEKIRVLLRAILVVAIFVVSVRVIFLNLKSPEPTIKNTNVYNPSETVISGSNIKEEDIYSSQHYWYRGELPY